MQLKKITEAAYDRESSVTEMLQLHNGAFMFPKL